MHAFILRLVTSAFYAMCTTFSSRIFLFYFIVHSYIYSFFYISSICLFTLSCLGFLCEFSCLTYTQYLYHFFFFLAAVPLFLGDFLYIAFVLNNCASARSACIHYTIQWLFVRAHVSERASVWITLTIIIIVITINSNSYSYSSQQPTPTDMVYESRCEWLEKPCARIVLHSLHTLTHSLTLWRFCTIRSFLL